MRLNGVLVYGCVVAHGNGVRVQITTDEAERPGLVAGQQVRVEWAGAAAARLLLTAADETPPVVWLRLTPLATRAAG